MRRSDRLGASSVAVATFGAPILLRPRPSLTRTAPSTAEVGVGFPQPIPTIDASTWRLLHPANVPLEHPTVLRTRDANGLFGASHVRWLVQSGRWQRPAKGVVVRHSGSLSFTESATCELLLQHPTAALGGLTAATLDGLRGSRRQAPSSSPLIAPERAPARRSLSYAPVSCQPKTFTPFVLRAERGFPDRSLTRRPGHQPTCGAKRSSPQLCSKGS